LKKECEEAGFGFRRWEERSGEERGDMLGKIVRSRRFHPFQGGMVIADRREEVNSAAGGEKDGGGREDGKARRKDGKGERGQTTS